MNTVNINGKSYSAEDVVFYMEDEIREKLHADGYTDEQAFVDDYITEHEAAYDEDFARFIEDNCRALD